MGRGIRVSFNLLAGAAAIVVVLAVARSVPDPPYGVSERVPWTTSRITGSPDPPPPFRTVRAFPKLKFNNPVDLVLLPTGDRYFLVEQFGKIFSFAAREGVEKADLAIDLKGDGRGLNVPDCKGVTESYAIAFDPEFVKNRACYVMYLLAHKVDGKNLENGSRVSRFRLTEDDPPRLDPMSETVVIEWLGGGHCGCALKFGKDGCLYISTGDGSNPSPPDALHTGQDLGDLLSSILRIDVRRSEAGRAYSIPKDNPFTQVAGARPEIWAYGLRNPWRMTFDRATGDLWVGDVGWEKWELVYRVERGGNYGWSIMEGPQPVNVTDKPGPTPILPPLQAIPHPEGQSITGGFVYRGKKFPELVGHYVYGDWETRLVWENAWDGKALGERKTIAITDQRIVGWAEDAQGELLIVDYEAGGLHRLERNDAAGASSSFPRTLGATGLFSSAAHHLPAPGVQPYWVNAPMWSDGADAERFVAVPSDARVGGKDREWIWPKDSVLAKTLSLDGRRVETQVLHFDGARWNGYAYLWNDAQTDAELVPAAGVSTTLRIAGRERPWAVLARTACGICHNRWPGFALAMDPIQLRRRVEYPEAADDQLRTLRHLGLVPPVKFEERAPLVDPYDASRDLAERAKSYLHVNCSHCHRFGAGGAALLNFLRYPPNWEKRNSTDYVNVRPKLGTFDLDSPYLVCGGDPSRSVLFYRVAKLGRGRMPHIGSEAVDGAGLELLARWIEQFPPPADARPRRGPPDLSLSTPGGALAAVRSLASLPAPAREDVIRHGLAHANPAVRDLFDRFAPPGTLKKRLGTSIDPRQILSLRGDPERGRELVFESTLQCRACHRFGTGDEKVGPDLGKIAAKYDRKKLLESILDPSKDIDPKYVSYLVQTAGGAVYNGILIEKTADRVVLQDAEKTIPLPASSVQRMVPQQKSMMPDFLLQDLTPQEAADLLEFLASLR